ncbi:MAG: TonB-dependent receptor [Bacteroidota bacterium]|nr:TonB-dependent receptor [Bacteroidota bacterium]
MSNVKLLVLFLFLMISNQLNAQNGIIRGSVFDGVTGESLPGVTIYIENISHGTITDLDGKFNLSVAPGTYDVRVSFISYETIYVKGVNVKEEEVTLLDDIGLNEATFEIASVVVTAKAIRNTENALIALKQKSPNLFDGISAATLRKTGDSDAAASVKRITGVSVTNGKYVYVRGLGDRYTKTMLNGTDIPGLDPDRNTLQMDIFPTNIIDNIIVHKSFSADLPADFTGGVVDIELKDFPDEKKGSISISAGYNPNFHFNSNYLTYDGGNTDFLGFDDGSRAIPATSNIPQYTDTYINPDAGTRYRSILKGFDNTMAAHKQTSLMDYGLGFSFGNQKLLKKHTIGYNFALSYKNSTDFYQNAEFGRYGLATATPDLTELVIRDKRTGDYGVNNVFLSGLAGFAIKTKTAKYRINLLHLQNGESKTGIFDFMSRDVGSEFDAFQHALYYTQRSLTNLLIDGKHSNNNSDWEVVWKLSPTISSIKDPDIRFTRYAYGSTQDVLVIGTESGFPERSWRELQETNLSGVTHVTKKFKFKGNDAKLKFGGAYTYKERDYEVQTFAINVRDIPLTGDPDELFREDNLWPYQGDVGRGTTYEANFIPTNSNKFNANVNYLAAYISTELNIFKNLKTVVGARVENYIQHYTGRNQQGNKILDNEEVIDDFYFFPSINFIYRITEKQNIRVSYSKTIARPSFKELSYAQIFDPISGVTFIGGLANDKGIDNSGNEVVYWNGNLVSTDIHNFDLRWEFFHHYGQMVSLSGFYKKFKNPIEMVQFATTQKMQIQPRNVGNAEVYGAEIEARQNLGFINELFNNFNVNANFTYVKSQVKRSKSEYDSRVLSARTGETIGQYRDMAGQSPYLLNLGLAYEGGTNGFWKGFESGLYYNVQGKTLQIVGIKDRPDVYIKPFHSLNFNISKQFENGIGIGLKIKNILNSKNETVYQSFNAQDQYYELRESGTSYSFSINYKF